MVLAVETGDVHSGGGCAVPPLPYILSSMAMELQPCESDVASPVVLARRFYHLCPPRVALVFLFVRQHTQLPITNDNRLGWHVDNLSVKNDFCRTGECECMECCFVRRGSAVDLDLLWVPPNEYCIGNRVLEN